MEYVYDDGGRKSAGFKGSTGDCVVRAIAIAAELSYQEVYNELQAAQHCHSLTGRDKYAKAMRSRKNISVRNGVWNRVYKPYLEDTLGWVWTPTMFVGKGCKVHLTEDELPAGRLICRLSKHLVAVVDRVAHDIYDCSRGGTRCVYGYWKQQ